jgi:hypothetical protein
VSLPPRKKRPRSAGTERKAAARANTAARAWRLRVTCRPDAECSAEDRRPEAKGSARSTEWEGDMAASEREAAATEITRRREGRLRARASNAPAESARTTRPGEGIRWRDANRRRRDSARKRAGRRRWRSAGKGWGWVLVAVGMTTTAAAERMARSGGSRKRWGREGSARAADARRKSEWSARRRRSAAAYGEAPAPAPAPAPAGRRVLDGVGRGVVGKRKEGWAARRGGTARRR